MLTDLHRVPSSAALWTRWRWCRSQEWNCGLDLFTVQICMRLSHKMNSCTSNTIAVKLTLDLSQSHAMPCLFSLFVAFCTWHSAVMIFWVDYWLTKKHSFGGEVNVKIIIKPWSCLAFYCRHTTWCCVEIWGRLLNKKEMFIQEISIQRFLSSPTSLEKE